jgi:hypothetical protein
VAECRDGAKVTDGVLAGSCFNCGESTHTLRECPQPIRNGQIH